MNKKLIAIGMTLVMTMSVMAVLPVAGAAPSGREISSRVAESEPNDNFTLAQTIQTTDTVTGTTGMLSSNPIDVFKVQLSAGEVIETSVETNSAGYNDLVVHFELYDKYQNKVAWSHSGHVWEALTALAKYDDWYYLMIIPWKGESISYTLYLDVGTPQQISDGDFVNPATPLSNRTNNPADWYRMNLNAGQTTNDMANLTCSFNADEVEMDLYFRDLEPNAWTHWLNFSWWGEAFGGGGGLVEEVEASAVYSGDYYADVQAWNGSGIYTLSVNKKSSPSDGDNTPEDSTVIGREPGETQAKFNGHLDMAYDHYDWYKIHLKEGQSITASMYLKNPWTQAIYRITVMRKDPVDDTFYSWSSWTNIKGKAVTGQAQAFVTDAPAEEDYYIRLMAQVPLHPSNKSNLADWHLNTAVGDYQLVVDLPMDELHEPTVKEGATTKVDVTEDTTNDELKLGQIFDDVDIGDPDLQDALNYTTAGTFEHITVNITGDAEGTVKITPEKDFNGQTTVTFVATDRYGLQNETDITVEVHGVNDPPAVLSSVAEILHDFTVKEGTVNQSNNDVVLVDKNNDPWSYKGFSDPDLEYGDLLDFEVKNNETGNAYVPVEIVEQNNYVTVKYQGAKVTNPTGDTAEYEVPITIEATDSNDESVTHTWNVTVRQSPPDINCVETVIYVDEGNTTVEDLGGICTASTGHDLLFEFLGGNSQNLTVKVNNEGEGEFKALGDYYNVNGENLNFKAYMTQPWEKTVYFTLNVVIENVNDDPEILTPQPDPQIAINIPEGEYEDFSASVQDIDNSPLEMRYTWFVDNVAVASGSASFRYKPDFDSEGPHTIKLMVKDGSGGEASFSWEDVNVDNTNRKPTARITTPQNNTQFDPGKKINFIAEASDPDGDPVTLVWMENGKEIKTYTIANGTGIHSWSDKFKPGTTHVIQLKVEDDKGAFKMYYLTIVIKPKKEETGPLPGFEAALMVVAVTLAVAVMAVRRRR